VDGVVAAFPNGIAILSPTAPNFLLGVEYLAFLGSLSLEDYILDDGCVQDPRLGQEILIDSEPGLLFPDTPCGAYGASILYLVRESMAYRITVETHAAFQEVSASVMDLLSTIRWINSETATWDRSRVGEARLISAIEG